MKETPAEPINILRYRMLAKGYLRNNEIATIIPCSRAMASKIIKRIYDNNKRNGAPERFRLFTHSVFTDELVDCMGWNMAEIEQMARAEKTL